VSNLHALHRYYRGVLLVYIAGRLGAEGKELVREVSNTLHVAFKEAFDISSTATITEERFKEYLIDIRVFMSVERGILCPIQYDPPELDELEMKEFLKLTLEWKR